ncbi:MAG TPA: hypothetical protein VKR58_04405, partial [Aquella sp.]|nr:hypothetical protein [Aquella sp.]
MYNANLLETFNKAVDSKDLPTIQNCLSRNLLLMAQSPSFITCINMFPSVVFKNVVDKENWKSLLLPELLESGFNKHMQSTVLMYAICY